MFKGMKLATVFAAGALALAACGSTSSSSTTSPGATNTKSPVKVGLAYDVGGRGDQSFNDSAATGLDKAKTELGIEVKELEATNGETAAQKTERLTTLAEGGYNPVIAVGFAYADSLAKVAPQFPDVSFAIIDDSSLSAKNKNVTSLVFAENEGSFLVGAIAAQASKTGNIGFVGGVNIPLIQKFLAGYQAGALAINPSIKVQSKYLTEAPDFSGFGDPAKGKVAAEGMYQNGADVVYHAAGGSGAGVFQAAAAAKALAIGVDSDQYLTAAPAVKNSIITSMLKRIDVAVFNEIKSFIDGTPLNGVVTFNLAKEGVGYAKSNSAVQPYEAKTDALRQQIIGGTITVPEKPTS